MTSKKKLEKVMKIYECNDVEQLYNYVVESYHNGQLEQVKEIMAELPKVQQIEAVEYVRIHAPEAYDFCQRAQTV